jgi:hypothetical protein
MNGRNSAALLFVTILALGACQKTDPPKTQVQTASPANTSAEAPSQPATTPEPPASATPHPSQTAPVKCSFEWIDSKNHPVIWKDVSSAFQQELLPDQLASKDDLDHYAWKKIVKMARCGEAVFVALEMRLGEKKEQQWNRQFQLYNFDLTTKEKTEIKAKWPFYLLEFTKLAHFDGDAAPDITFETDDCLECEPQIIFSAVRISPEDKKWALRPWQNAAEGIDIEDTGVGIDGSVEDYETLTGVADFLKEGRDQIALWTHYQELDEKDASKKLPPVTTMTVYGYRNGEAYESEVKDEAQMHRIKDQLCVMNPKDKACRTSHQGTASKPQ